MWYLLLVAGVWSVSLVQVGGNRGKGSVRKRREKEELEYAEIKNKQRRRMVRRVMEKLEEEGRRGVKARGQHAQPAVEKVR